MILWGKQRERSMNDDHAISLRPEKHSKGGHAQLKREIPLCVRRIMRCLAISSVFSYQADNWLRLIYIPLFFFSSASCVDNGTGNIWNSQENVSLKTNEKYEPLENLSMKITWGRSKVGRWGKGIKDPRHPPLGVSSGRSSSTRAGSFPSRSSTHIRLGANFTQRGSQRHRLLTRSHLEGHRFLPAAAVTFSLPVPHTTEKLAYPLFVLKYQANVAQANVAVATDRLYIRIRIGESLSPKTMNQTRSTISRINVQQKWA